MGYVYGNINVLLPMTWPFTLNRHCEQICLTHFQISDVLSSTTIGASALVPNQGWVIFGGYQSSLLTSQKLQSLNGTWEEGPNLFRNDTDNNNCAVQVT
jgi:hypothetical protein